MKRENGWAKQPSRSHLQHTKCVQSVQSVHAKQENALCKIIEQHRNKKMVKEQNGAYYYEYTTMITLEIL